MKFVFATDDNYWLQTFVAIYSLVANNCNGQIEIYILCENIDPKFQKGIKYLKTLNPDVTVNFLIVKKVLEKLDNFKVREHLTKGTYYRFFIQEFLPPEVDKIAYLDGDIIVNGSLAELFNVDLEHHLMAAVPQIDGDGPIRLGLPTGSKYFNAGVLVINVKKWRDDDISTKLMKFSEEKRDIVQWPSQDPLNAVTAGQWVELPKKFNFYHGFTEKEYERYKHIEPVIIHYSGLVKPWNYKGKHPYKSIYWSYLRNTPYRFHVPDDFNLLSLITENTPQSIRALLRRK